MKVGVFLFLCETAHTLFKIKMRLFLWQKVIRGIKKFFFRISVLQDEESLRWMVMMVL